MPNNNLNTGTIKWVSIVSAALLLVSFFLPWVAWKDAALSGNALPVGHFFEAAKEKFGVGNPFPQFSIAFKVFWLIPVGAAASIPLTFLNKKSFWPAVVAGLLSLSLVLVYFLFSQSMVKQLGVSKSVWAITRPWLFVHAATAITIVLSAAEKKWILKTGLVVLTAAITVIGFSIAGKQAEKKIFEEKFASTDDIKADYTLSADDLLKEFLANDTAANKKYNEKVLQVNGLVSAIDVSADSTGTLRFEDSTGSYAIFSLEKNQFDKVKNIKPGDAVSVKGICSGSIFSDILGTTSISFKRSILNKQ
ncbi:MAG: hypothetical protein HZB42_11075 [Sphingobacteriales bacterium]|nr:hypothetical protein [Sphingobacteriales bacterium]